MNRCVLPVDILQQLTSEFEKSCQLFIGTNDKPLSVVAVRVCHEMGSSVVIL